MRATWQHSAAKASPPGSKRLTKREGEHTYRSSHRLDRLCSATQVYTYRHIIQLNVRKKPWVWRTAGKGVWEGLEWGKGRDKFCNYNLKNKKITLQKRAKVVWAPHSPENLQDIWEGSAEWWPLPGDLVQTYSLQSLYDSLRSVSRVKRTNKRELTPLNSCNNGHC